MKAQVLKATDTLALEERPRPRPGPGEVLVRVTHSGVCGTDLKIYRGGIPVRHPLVMGHEMIGRVEGGEAGSLKPGDRVIVDPVTFCGVCFWCRAGQQHLCPDGRLMGRDVDGGFAEYLVVPAANLHRLPDSVSDEVAPLIQVLTTCLHAQRLVQIFPGEAVVVIGLGVAGQLHVQLAKARGAHPVIGVSRSAWKLDLARRLGADLTLPVEEDVEGAVREATGGRGADLVIESVGKVATLAQAVRLARVGGRLLVFGVLTEQEGALPFYQLYFKELAVINSRAAKAEDYPASIDLVARGAVRLEPLVSHRLPLAELPAALDLLTNREVQRMKVILEHG